MRIIAHRGASGAYPENTMAAFHAGWEAGAEGIELDVRLSADGELVVMHDASGWRTCAVDRAVADSTWTDMAGWNAGAGVSYPEVLGVPRLKDVLEAAPAGLIVLIEVKDFRPAVAERLVLECRAFPGLDLRVLCFDRSFAAAFARRQTGFPLLLNVEPDALTDTDALVAFARDYGLAGLSLGWSTILHADLVGRLKRDGLQTAVWTLNTIEQARAASGMGFDLIMTDWPERLVPELRHG